MSFQRIHCVGVGVHVSICAKCRKIIAWSPKPELLRIAEVAHRHGQSFLPTVAIVKSASPELRARK